MRAAVRHRFGSPDVIEVEEVDSPELTDDGVLVRVCASSVNKADWYSVTGRPWIGRFQMGLLRPKTSRLGTDLAGTVEAVGSRVRGFEPGDEVYGARTGAYAQLVVVKNAVTRKPANLSCVEAAAVPTAAITALQGLRDHAQLQSGQRVLINGASGGVGTFAIQIAKALEAEVTAVCSTANVEQALSLGADHVIDYMERDFTQDGDIYDVVFDVAGSRPWSDVKRVLAPTGIDVLVGAPTGNLIFGPLGFIIRTRVAAMMDSQQTRFFIAQLIRPDLEVLTEMIESGMVKPVVERSFELDATREAFRDFGQGHNRAKTVITV